MGMRTGISSREAIRPSWLGIPQALGVDSLSILFNHRSFQKPAVLPGFPEVFLKEGSLERMGKVPLEKFQLRCPVFSDPLQVTPAFSGRNSLMPTTNPTENLKS